MAVPLDLDCYDSTQMLTLIILVLSFLSSFDGGGMFKVRLGPIINALLRYCNAHILISLSLCQYVNMSVCQ